MAAGKGWESTMDSTNTTSARDQINAKQAAIATLRDEIRDLEAQAEAEALSGQVESIATALGADPDRVAAFLAEVAQRSHYSVSYLLTVITGERASSPAYGWSAV